MKKHTEHTCRELLRKLEGVHSIESVMSILKVDKKKAIYYLYRLRRKGYVKTKKQSNNKRVYYISFENKLGGKSYVDIINQHSPIKVSTLDDYKIYGTTPSIEESLIWAIKSKSLRIILASLALFKKVKKWKEIYNLAKLNNIKREVGALYDLSRRIMKTRRMPKRVIANCLPKKIEKYKYILGKLKSEDFKEIENKWRVYIPFNFQDLKEYK